MALVDGSGLAEGEATTEGAGSLLFNPDGLIEGAATVVGAGGLIHLVSGHAGGSGSLLYDISVLGAGVAEGAATVQGDGLRLVLVSHRITGTSSMTFSYPRPMLGTSVMVGEPTVTCVPRPVSVTVTPSKSFRYLQEWARGDLALFISDPAGPVSPYLVTYTLFKIRSDKTWFQVGPADRTPARGAVGEYYVTGRAGESGQPGLWAVRWTFQRSIASAFQTKSQRFLVVDAAAARDPRDVTQRVRRYGWT